MQLRNLPKVSGILFKIEWLLNVMSSYTIAPVRQLQIFLESYLVGWDMLKMDYLKDINKFPGKSAQLLQ